MFFSRMLYLNYQQILKKILTWLQLVNIKMHFSTLLFMDIKIGS